MDTSQYKSVFQIAFVASVLMLVIIPTQILVFLLFPMPTDVKGWFDLFHSNPLVAVFHSDLLILVNNVLISVMYLAFYHLLKETNKGLIQVGILLGTIGIAGYISSNKTFEWMTLASQYYAASPEGDQQILLAAGRSLLVGWQGTAFDTYYVLNGLTLLIISGLMFRSRHFTKETASFGLASGILMCVPSTAGVLGLVFSLLSLVPWYIFTILFSRTFLRHGTR